MTHNWKKLREKGGGGGGGRHVVGIRERYFVKNKTYFS
jgi:hypothetical protein